MTESEIILGLKDLCNRLLGSYRGLLELLRVEHEALRDCRIKEIEEIAFNKESLLCSIQFLELERTQLQQAIAAQWNFPLEDVKMTALIDRIRKYDPKSAENLDKLRISVQVLVEQAHKKNTENRVLAERGLSAVKGVMNQFYGDPTVSENRYDKMGKTKVTSTGDRSRFLEITG